MTFIDIATIVPALVAAGGTFYAIAKFVSRVDRNTEATERLTASFDRAAERTDAMLSDHEHRITVLETKGA